MLRGPSPAALKKNQLGPPIIESMFEKDSSVKRNDN